MTRHLTLFAVILAFAFSAFGKKGGLPPKLTPTNEVVMLSWNRAVVQTAAGSWHINGPNPLAEVPPIVTEPEPTPPALSAQLNTMLVGKTNMAYGAVSNTTQFGAINQATNALFPTGIHTNFWLRSVSGFRGIAFNYYSSGCATLVSPEHYVVAGHSIAPYWAWHMFYGSNGSSNYSGTMSWTNFGPTYPASGVYVPEFVVGLLSNAVASAETVPVADMSVINALESGTYILSFTRQTVLNHWVIPRLMHSVDQAQFNLSITHLSQSSLPTVTPFYTPVNGDSGGGNFLVVTNRLVFIGTHTMASRMTSADANHIKLAMDMLSDNAGRARQPLTVMSWTNNAIVWRTLE